MSKLFSKTKLRSLDLDNRIVVSPMCQYVANNGKATAWHSAHLGSLAVSGAGMLVFESTSVEPEGRITPGDLGLWDDATEAALGAVVNSIRSFSSTPLALQIGHAGRKASSHTPWDGGQLIAANAGGWLTSAPSAIAQRDGEALPVTLDGEGLSRVLMAHVAAAKRAARLGFDALELHGGHGYLLHQFMSPISNKRTDQYGGTLANRMRFPLEVFKAVREVFPDHKPVGIKLSATDWVEGGWDIAQSIELAKKLKDEGVDWITASSGGISPLQKISPVPGYQVDFAKAIKEATGLHTIAVGLITDAKQAERIIADGSADSVALARAMLYDPRWPWHAAAQLGGSISTAPSYWRAAPQGASEIFGLTSHGSR